jgi:hypothetical protein
LTKAALLRNLDIARKLGCLDKAGLADVRRAIADDHARAIQGRRVERRKSFRARFDSGGWTFNSSLDALVVRAPFWCWTWKVGHWMAVAF